jgi:polysaccharide transporter, PST family
MPIFQRFQKLLIFRDRERLSKILTNISWLFADRILRMGFGLVVSVWIARYLGIEQFGIFNYANALISLFSPFANLGLDAVVVNKLVRDPSQQQYLLGTSFWMRFWAGWLTWAIAILSIFLLRHDDQTSILVVIILGGTSVLQSFDTIELWFQSQVQSKYSVFAKNIAFVIAIIFKVGLIIAHAPLIAFAVISLLEFGLGAMGLIIVYGQQDHLISLWRWSTSLAKSLIKESLPLIFSSLSIMIYLRIDQIMLGQMSGSKVVGIYSAATKISEIWYFIPMAIAASVSPSIYEAKQLNEDLYYYRIGQLNRLLLLCSIGFAVPMTFFSEKIVTLIFGNSYAEAGSILAINIWASVFVFMGVATSSWFMAEGLNHLSMYRTLAGAIANVILNVFLIPTHGAIGAAIATVISYAIPGLIFQAIHPKTRKLFKVQMSLFLRT